MDDFDELMARVTSLTGLTGRDAAKVAFEMDEDARPQDIVEKAIELGFDVDRKHDTKTREFAPEMSLDPAEVLSEVYQVMPRVMCSLMPKLGKAPQEAMQHEEFAEIINQMPDEMKAMLVRLDMSEGAATFWLYDAANEIDRRIGPIDITRYGNERALEQAFHSLMQRMNKVLASDWN